MSEFYDKYLKYKNKYLNLKTELAQDGGMQGDVLCIYSSQSKFGQAISGFITDHNNNKKKHKQYKIQAQDLFADPSLFTYKIGEKTVSPFFKFPNSDSFIKLSTTNLDKDTIILPEDAENLATGYQKILTKVKEHVESTENITKRKELLNLMFKTAQSKLTIVEWENVIKKESLRSKLTYVGAEINCNQIDVTPLFRPIDSIIVISFPSTGSFTSGFKIINSSITTAAPANAGTETSNEGS